MRHGMLYGRPGKIPSAKRAERDNFGGRLPPLRAHLFGLLIRALCPHFFPFPRASSLRLSGIISDNIRTSALTRITRIGCILEFFNRFLARLFCREREIEDTSIRDSTFVPFAMSNKSVSNKALDIRNE